MLASWKRSTTTKGNPEPLPLPAARWGPRAEAGARRYPKKDASCALQRYRAHPGPQLSPGSHSTCTALQGATVAERDVKGDQAGRQTASCVQMGMLQQGENGARATDQSFESNNATTRQPFLITREFAQRAVTLSVPRTAPQPTAEPGKSLLAHCCTYHRTA